MDLNETKAQKTVEDTQIRFSSADKGFVPQTQVLTDIYQCDILNFELTLKKKNVVNNTRAPYLKKLVWNLFLGAICSS